MATCRTIIRRAMQEVRALASGEEPTADELADGLDLLQEIYDGLFGFGLGTSLSDVEIEADTDLTADTRALVFAEQPITLNFPESPQSGQRVQIHDVLGMFPTYPVTIVATPTNITLSVTDVYTFVYNGESASWELISGLTADTTMPLGDDQFFRLELAVRMAPTFGASLSAESQAAYLKASNRIRARFRSSAIIPCDDGVRFLSDQSYRTGFIQ